MRIHRLEHAYYRPGGPLGEYVDYIQVSIGKAGEQTLAVPTLVRPYCRLSVKFAGPIYIRRASVTSRTPSFGLIGINQQRYESIARGDIGVVLVGFKPWAVRCFFDVEVDRLRDSTLRLGHHHAGGGENLRATLRSCRDTDEIVAATEAFLRARMSPGRRDSLVEKAVSLIVDRGGAVRIGDVARACFLGARQLRRRFGAAVGTTPKPYARIVRFHRALGLAARESDWTRVAIGAGYSDLPHLDREFRGFAGAPPTDLASARSPGGWVANTLERNRHSSATAR